MTAWRDVTWRLWRFLRMLFSWASARSPDSPDLERGMEPLERRIRHRLLIVHDDDVSPQLDVGAALAADEAFECRRVSWRQLSGQNGRLSPLDLMIVVAAAPTPGVMAALDWLHTHPVTMPILATLPGDIDESLLHACAAVADDCLFAPIRPIELRHRVRTMLAHPRGELEEVRGRLREEAGLAQLVGRDPVFLRAIEQLPRYARTDFSVLITGETGTGKEVCARALHHLGRRRDFPFIAVDGGALPDQLFESELFGHARGAFTDAHRDHKGCVAMAEGGSLFLDEIDALSLAAQAKLLRFLQEHTFRPLGSERVERADIKVIAATNRDLEALVKDGRFRADLFFRLNVLRIHVPPLRARRGDIEPLAYHALDQCRASLEHAPTGLSPGALRLLAAYDWPGNVRELRNVVQRAAVACERGLILPSHLALPIAGDSEDDAEPPPTGAFREERAAAVAAFERRYVEDLLRKHEGNVTHAAREAQQNRRVFGRFIKKYNIDRRALRASADHF